MTAGNRQIVMAPDHLHPTRGLNVKKFWLLGKQQLTSQKRCQIKNIKEMRHNELLVNVVVAAHSLG